MDVDPKAVKAAVVRELLSRPCGGWLGCPARVPREYDGFCVACEVALARAAVSLHEEIRWWLAAHRDQQKENEL